jgi:hypothetical protein
MVTVIQLPYNIIGYMSNDRILMVVYQFPM